MLKDNDACGDMKCMYTFLHVSLNIEITKIMKLNTKQLYYNRVPTHFQKLK